jgi:hypothetical protein
MTFEPDLTGELKMQPILQNEGDLLSAQQKLPPDTPVVMLNLVAFNGKV